MAAGRMGIDGTEDYKMWTMACCEHRDAEQELAELEVAFPVGSCMIKSAIDASLSSPSSGAGRLGRSR